MFLSQAPGVGGGLSTQRCSLNSAPRFRHPIPPLFSSRRPNFCTTNNPTVTQKRRKPITATNSDPSSTNSKPTTSFNAENPITFVGEENVPLEGVIQFEKPTTNTSNLINKWGRVALLAGGDVLAILLFAAIGRLSHGFSVFSTETLRTADPFMAGWFLSAYFLGGYGEDGRGMNGRSKAVIAAAKSWSLGIPLGIIIRASSVGHIPATSFVLVTMGSTSVLLIGWRALLFSFFTTDNKESKNDVYKRGSPFQLFELLTSLIRRW